VSPLSLFQGLFMDYRPPLSSHLANQVIQYIIEGLVIVSLTYVSVTREPFNFQRTLFIG